MRRIATLTAIVVAHGVFAPPLLAQRVDSVRAGAPAPDTAKRRATVARRDTLGGPPLSPRRAFLRSFLIPGLGQTALHRGNAGAVFVTMEALSLVMIVKSKHDLTVARRLAGTPIFEGTRDSTTATGVVVVPMFSPSPLAGRVSARKQHVEDWVTLLIFNHLFAAADAFVAAHLWDVPARVSVSGDERAIAIAARVAW